MTEEEREHDRHVTEFIEAQALRKVSARRSIEKMGGKWDEPVTYDQLWMSEDRMVQMLLDHKEWISNVEARIEKMQIEVAHTSGHAMHFAGDWQRAMNYGAGAVVSHADASWTAIVDIKSGSKEPGQQGAHWARLS